MVWIPCGNRILYLEVKNTHLLEVEKLKGGLREIGNDAGQLVKVKSLSHLKLFATPWTVAYQAPPSMGFSSKSALVDCYFLLQGIFPTQESNLGLPHCWQTLYRLSHQGSPTSCEGGNTDEMSDQADDEKN